MVGAMMDLVHNSLSCSNPRNLQDFRFPKVLITNLLILSGMKLAKRGISD